MKYNFDKLSRFSNDITPGTLEKIKQVLIDLHRRGLLERFDSECIAAADILQHALTSKGVKCRLLECQLSVVSVDQRRGLVWNFIGFDNHFGGENAVDTHVVVVVEDTFPIILDISIPKTIGGSSPWVIERLNIDDHLVLGKYEIENMNLTYHPKVNPRLIGLHRKTLLERLRADQKIEKNLKSLRTLVILLMILVLANFSRGAYDFYQTYIIDSNDWGPIEKKKE